MARPVTLFTGQWADLPLAELAPKVKELGYDGLELACWGDHLDVFKGAKDPAYAKGQRKLLEDNGLALYSISNHLAGQLVADPNDDSRTDAFAPPEVAGDAEGKRAWAIEAMVNSAKTASNIGVDVVNGFTGSPIWHYLYSFPPVTPKMIEDGYARFAELWKPILDEFQKLGIKFALEVHPTEIAYDIETTHQALKAIDYHPAFGFNFDPSHLHWQFVDPVVFINEFSDRIFHVHMKDAARTLDGKSGILASHLNFGDHRRGWDFRSVGRGEVDFESIIRALNRIGYEGPLSVEWEDTAMDRWTGARESCAFTKQIDFQPSGFVFDEAFSKK